MTAGELPQPESGASPAPAAGPIADLSYRGYDGPLHDRRLRWWIITFAMLRPLPRKPLFWICMSLCSFPYFITGLIMYFQAQAQSSGLPQSPLSPPETYAVHFYQSFVPQSFFLFLIALLVGSGAMASDFRANALQVYLARPITRVDYLVGKWAGVFLPVYTAALMPAILFYVYCLLSFIDKGFLSQDPWLIVRVIGMAAIPALLHASLIVLFSAWSRSAFMAGAAHAALYFASTIIAQFVWVYQYGMKSRWDPSRGQLVHHLSMNGIITGLAQNLLSATPHQTVLRRSTGDMHTFVLTSPPAGPLFVLALILVLGSVLLARQRVCAVEIIRG